MSKSTHSQPQPGLDDEADDTEVLGKKGVRSATDIQRLKLEKLLKNPVSLILIFSCVLCFLVDVLDLIIMLHVCDMLIALSR